MVKTIRKIGNYALLGTIISANATAPAQAASLQNVTPDDGLTTTPHKEASASDRNNLASVNELDQAHSCISSPEFDFCNQFKNDNYANSLKGSLLQKAKNSIELIQAGEAIKVKASENEVYYIYDIESTASEIGVPGKKQDLNTYTNIWKQPELSAKKKVPESSMLLGLIAFCLFAVKRQAAKNNWEVNKFYFLLEIIMIPPCNYYSLYAIYSTKVHPKEKSRRDLYFQGAVVTLVITHFYFEPKSAKQ